jgi:hypothetical protein
MMRTTTWMLWASLLSATGCNSGLSVPYDEIYVPCVTDEDCPREASECRTHRFYTAPSRTEVEEYRQCSRACRPGTCPDGTVSELEGARDIVVDGSCLAIDEAGVFDGLREFSDGYCVAYPNRRRPDLPRCPTRGTEVTEVSVGTGFGSFCLPAPAMSTSDAGP